jgi:hypothetical protein
MLILIPWKPVVFVWLLLSAMCLFWAGAMCVVEGRNPFGIPKHNLHSSVSQVAGHQGLRQKHLHKAKSAGARARARPPRHKRAWSRRWTTRHNSRLGKC